MTVSEAVEILKPAASDYMHRGVNVNGETVVIFRACLEMAGGWMTLDGAQLGEPAGVRWTYDGGAGGVSSGIFSDADSVRDWLTANADAI
ncbi:MAG: hypothetical protein EBT03_11690 [Betaproteobacteria bacterium]|nr:hypothetical protein [Betaproteobacteria bacterium]